MSCKFCHKETAEDQIQCATCKELCHPSCLELPAHIVPVVKTYDWQCNDCKYCNGCHATDNEKQILFCDRCDRGYHMYCVKPPIRKKPKGDWFCPCCVAVKLSNKDGSDLSFNPENTKKVTGTKRSRPKEQVSSSEDNPPQQKITKDSISATTDSSATSSKAATSEIPVEHVVSKTDIEMYEAAKKKAETLMALDKAMCPQDDSVKTIRLGDVEMEAWYQSQYPLDFSKSPKLFICEFCFDYSKTETIYKRHMAKCTFRHPPGEEIYRKDKLSVFEVDGQTATKYCQNLCLLAKLFLDHKTLWMDVGPFLFYIMTIADETGCHIIGYFSKEKVSFLNYNVSCILVMPNYMKKGYGQMLIEFSYLLSQKEGRTGSPERPLSDLGLMSYRKFWEEKLLRYLMEYSEDQISIKGLSETMSIHPSDIVSTLQFLGMLKYWKGKHLILLRKEIIEEYTTKAKTKPNNDREIDPLCLKWTPKVFK